LALLFASVQARAQEQAPAAAPAPNAQTQKAAAPAAAGPVVKDIRVRGTQRIEPGTVLSYISVRPGDP
jgi:outer membrane protein insertion porin family